MGKVEWNKGQQAVLDSIGDDRNLLVSAAAGSGKTAVLVERIVDSVAQGLCEIDQILVMTFTKAAAAQMKGKIIEKLEERAYEKEDPVLLGQLSKAANADISTIDSFCNRVVRENFQAAGLDPGFVQMDNGERELLREEIMDHVMETMYHDPEFSGIAAFFTKRAYDDSALREVLFRIEDTAEGYADPEGWLEKSDIPEDADMNSLTGMKEYLEYLKRKLRDIVARYPVVDGVFWGDTADPGQVAKLLEILNYDREIYQAALQAADLVDFHGLLSTKKKTLDRRSFKTLDPDRLDEVVNLRKEANEEAGDLKIKVTRETLEQEVADCGKLIRELIRAVRLFRSELAEEKKRRRKYDFGDVAHAAYHILYDTEKHEVTEVGRAYSQKYRYIYVDEYQDGTDMQEHIMNSVARYRDGVPYNIFMVGDVKQSIYRFRQAKPELFLKKEEDYREGKVPGSVLYLNQNYRSTYEILEATNFFFRKLMRKDFGEIEYTEEVQLNPPEGVEKRIRPEYKVELILGDIPKEDETEEGKKDSRAGAESDRTGTENGEASGKDDEQDTPQDQPMMEKAPENKATLEARMIGKRILELVYGNPETGEGPLLISEKAGKGEEPKQRPVEFSDIVLLQRSVKKCGDLIREFDRLGIPVQLEDPKAYFDAEEVMTVLSTLAVIDNGRQDIPYAAVLHSQFGGCTDEDMARLAMQRIFHGEPLYDTAVRLMEGESTGKLEELRQKLARVHNWLDCWRKASVYLSIAQLIDRILTDTDYRLYVMGLPKGDRRQSNLMRLIIKAEDFEQAGNHGLFSFLRYIDKCKIHEADFGVGSGFREVGNCVRVCTIHSSKGLEYPVVFLTGLGNQFFKANEKGPAVVSAHYGIAPNYIRKVGNRYYQSDKGVIRKAVEKMDWQENLHEELRLLYVGMTRAKERLIMVGIRDGILEDVVNAEPTEGELPYSVLADAKSYLEYILAVVLQNVEEAKKYLDITILDPEELQVSKVQTERTEPEGEVPDTSALAERLKEDYNFEYKYASAVKTPTKLSVSEIKHEAMAAKHLTVGAGSTEEEPQAGIAAAPEAGKEETEKRNRKTAGISGADYGTAVHKLMELLPFAKIGSEKELSDTLKELLETRYFTPELRKAIHAERIARIYDADENSLFQRIRRADEKGLFRREQQFLIALPAKRLGQEIDVAEVQEAHLDQGEAADPRFSEEKKDIRFETEEPVVLQGVIDAFFLETDEEGRQYAVLLDYKTDRVDSPERLIDLYRAQLSLYAETVADILQMPVREMWLYGFSEGLGAIRIPD